MDSSVSYSVSKKIRAPLGFVFEWCTDFREGDPGLWGSPAKNIILDKSDKKVVYRTERRRGEVVLRTTSTVTLSPPDAWHVNADGDEREYRGDYRLRSRGDYTELEIKFVWRTKGPVVRTAAELSEGSSAMWDKLVKALENDYRSARS